MAEQDTEALKKAAFAAAVKNTHDTLSKKRKKPDFLKFDPRRIKEHYVPKPDGSTLGSRERPKVLAVREAMQNAAPYHKKTGLGLWKKKPVEQHTDPVSASTLALK